MTHKFFLELVECQFYYCFGLFFRLVMLQGIIYMSDVELRLLPICNCYVTVLFDPQSLTLEVTPIAFLVLCDFSEVSFPEMRRNVIMF